MVTLLHLRALSTFLFALVVLVLAVGCNAGTQRAADGPRETVALSEKYGDLREAVRAEPKVQIAGSQAFLRSGQNSSISNNEIRFAMNGQIIGTLNDAFQLVSLRDVKRLRVLDTQEASSRYGMQGASGVIEIVPL